VGEVENINRQMDSTNPLHQIYIIATPIGNLKDISLRAIEILKSVDIVVCEDTRKTGRLLKHFDISKPLEAFYEHNETKAIIKIENHINNGKTLAFVTTAGTPGISDPGYKLVQMSIKQNIPITMIPGPSALIMAIILSGLPTYSFTFRGFPPRRSSQRCAFLKADQFIPYTLIYYESPHRLVEFLRDAIKILGDRQAAIMNDLTKLYETIQRGSLSELIAEVEKSKQLGEYVVVINGFQPK
jgi:16S rRNA (cytidine1402-2'-O)-methyltransferase